MDTKGCVGSQASNLDMTVVITRWTVSSREQQGHVLRGQLQRDRLPVDSIRSQLTRLVNLKVFVFISSFERTSSIRLSE